MRDVGQWLDGIGLGRYARLFAENQIDLEVAPELTDRDLRELGIPLGHRKRLLRAIRELELRRSEAESEVEADVTGEAERRQLTVMFCDLVGSTALSTRLDPEDFREVIQTYQGTVAQAVRRFDGHVAKTMGDGALVYFGYPRAHEDDPERAVRAGLGIVDAVAGLEPLPGVTIDARVGIATGLVVAGDMVGDGVTEAGAALGEIPNLAARLQAAAAPNTVVVSEATRSLTGGLFAYDDLGRRDLKGLAEPVRAWRVAAERVAGSRFEVIRSATLTSFVGREHELGLLLERWGRARVGKAQVVVLSGEAGIGKSRILQNLRERLGAQTYGYLTYQCSPHHVDSALHPVTAQLHLAAGLAPQDSAARSLDKLERQLAKSSAATAEVAPLFAELLSISPTDRYAPLDLPPELKKERMLSVIADHIVGMADRQPLLTVVEDVHWIDPTTEELLGILIDRVEHHPILMVVTSRLELTAPWITRDYVTALTLGRLGPGHCTEMIGDVTTGKALPPEVLDHIVEKTDGVPLFVEEVTRAVLDAGFLREEGGRYELTTSVPEHHIPATLQDSLNARLDRLGPVKELAQTAAAIGREFSHELLAAVSRMRESELADALDRLTRLELIHPQGTAPGVGYAFKHALVQDAAYDTLLRPRRRALHGRIAEVLEHRFPDVAETQPEVLARHCAEAGLDDKAVAYWRRAGERAIERSAYREAGRLLEQALAASSALPETRESQEQAIDIRVSLRAALIGVGELDRVLGHLVEAEDLARRTGDNPRRLSVHLHKSYLLSTRGVFDPAIESAEKALEIAESLGGAALVAEARLALGQAYALRADGRRAIDALAPIADYCRSELRHARQGQAGVRSVWCLAHLSAGYGELGEFSKALSLAEEAFAIAEEVRRPFDLAHAQCRLGVVLLNKGEIQEAIRQLEAAREICEPADIPLQQGWVATYLGYAFVLNERFSDARALLSRAVDLCRTLDYCRMAWAAVFLARTCILEGSHGEAAQHVDTAASLAEAYGYPAVKIHTLRLRGALAASRDQPDLSSAVKFLRDAVDLAAQWALRPELAHCHRALGELYEVMGQGESAPRELASANQLYRTLGMNYWRARPETI